ncbi:MAG: amino acid ABC transporter substrate-binding protein [Candidatus Binataceae bacterium]
MNKFTIGLSLSLTGDYAAMGRQAEAALALFVSDTNMAGGVELGGKRYELALDCRDDESRSERVAEIYRELCHNRRADVIFGPYSSALTRAAAPIADQAAMVIVNHGGADDGLYQRRYRMIVGVLTPAGDYFEGFGDLLASLKLWRKRLAIVAARTPFARAVAGGLERRCKERPLRRRGVRVRLKYNGAYTDRTRSMLLPGIRRTRANALVSAGSYAHDIAVMRLIVEANCNIPVLGCVAAGVDSFARDLGDDAEGIVGPSQWEEQAEVMPAIGPQSAEFARRYRIAAHRSECDYPAAQAYAAGLITLCALRAAGSLEQEVLRAAFADLHTSTFFGDFALASNGQQIGHRMLLVQWHRGRKVIIDPGIHTAAQGELELPAGWRVIVAGFQALRLTRRDEIEENPDDTSDDKR